MGLKSPWAFERATPSPKVALLLDQNRRPVNPLPTIVRTSFCFDALRIGLEQKRAPVHHCPMMKITTLALAATFAFASVAVAPVSAVAQGKKFRSDLVEGCIPCHGTEGIAKEADVPHLAGQNELYLYNQIKAFQSGKRPHKEMRYMSRNMSDEEIDAIAGYYANLPSR